MSYGTVPGLVTEQMCCGLGRKHRSVSAQAVDDLQSVSNVRAFTAVVS